MKFNLSKLSMAVPLVVGSVIGITSTAQAAGFNGTIDFTFDQNVTFNRVNIDFGSNGNALPGNISIKAGSDLGDFAGVTGGAVKDLVTGVPTPNVLDTGDIPILGGLDNFITFTGGASPIYFDLTTFRRSISPGTISLLLGGVIEKAGVFTDTAFTVLATADTNALLRNPTVANLNAFFGTGNPGITRILPGAGTTVGATAVPEPMTILGSSMALASIAALKRKQKSKRELANV